MAAVRIDLLGGFRVRIGDLEVPDAAWSRRSAAHLVELLALAPDRSLHREQVVAALWPRLPAEEAQPRLHTALHYARRALGGAAAVARRGTVLTLLPEADVEVDVERFLGLARAALGEPTAAAVDAALAANGGDLLPGELFEAWTEPDRDRVRQAHLAVLRAGCRWEELLALQPADEEAHLALMRAAADRDDVRGALRQFERLDRALRAELGVAPGPEAVALRNRLLPASQAPAPARLVGRRAQLERLDAALRRTLAGRGATVLVSGAAGAGTSAVLDRARTDARRSGARVGWGAASLAEGAWPYAPVLEAVADLCRQHPAVLDDLDAAYRREIERALRGGEGGWPGDGAHQRLFVAVAELMRVASAGVAAVLVVDDLHEADEDSLRLLHYLARALGSEPVLLVGGSRRAAAGSPLGRMRASLLRRQAAIDLPLPPLSEAGTAALLGQLLGAPADAAVVREVHRLSSGLPLRIRELGPAVTGSGPRPLPAGALFAGWPPGTAEAVGRLALAGSRFDTDEFVAVAGVGTDAAFALLDGLVAAGVVQPGDRGYRFGPGLREKLLPDLPPHRLQQLHREIATALRSADAPPAAVGRHLIAAGCAAEAVPHLLAAAERAAGLGAYRDALALLDEVPGAVGGEDAARLLELRADLLRAVGDPDAVAAYRAAAAATSGPRRRVLLARLAQAASLEGDRDTAAEALAGLEPDGGPADGSILLARGLVAYFDGDLAAAGAAAAEVQQRIGDGSDWRLLELVTLQGMIAHDRGEWFRRLRHELQRTREAPEIATAVFDAHLCVAEFLLYGPTPYAEVRRLGRLLAGTAERSGALRALAFARALIGEAALLSGELDEAEENLGVAVELHARIGASAGEAHSLQRLAELRVLQGDRAAARRLLTRALPRARWSPIAMHLVQRIAGTTIAAADTAAEAYAAAEAAQAASAPQDRCLFCQIMVSVPSAIACADAGDLDAARRHLREAEGSPVLPHSAAWRGAVLEARAHLAAAEADTETSRRLLDEAADCFEAAEQPLDARRCRTGLPATVGPGVG